MVSNLFDLIPDLFDLIPDLFDLIPDLLRLSVIIWISKNLNMHCTHILIRAVLDFVYVNIIMQIRKLLVYDPIQR